MKNTPEQMRQKRLNSLKKSGWIFAENHSFYRKLFGSKKLEELTNIEFGKLKKEIYEKFAQRRNEGNVPLKLTTSFFFLTQEVEAKDHAKGIRSYVGRAYNEEKEWIGYYVPA